jgi:uncharacterized protein (TIGR00661 family)
MRVLYGVVGEGMGHATRSRVVLEHLLAAGHEVRVVVSGRAHGFLLRVFKDRPRIHFDEIHGLKLAFEGSELDLPETVWENIDRAMMEFFLANVNSYAQALEGYAPQDNGALFRCVDDLLAQVAT